MKLRAEKREIEKAIKELRRKFQPNPLDIPKELCYLTEKYREQYLHDMEICQRFAVRNRGEIAKAILSAMN